MKNGVRLISIAVVILLQACGTQAPGVAHAPPMRAPMGPLFLKVGEKAPAFTARTLDGRQVSLDSYRGQTLLLFFTTTFCPECREQTPALIREYKALHSPTVSFLRIDLMERASTVRDFATAYGEPYPVALDPKGKVAYSGYDVLPEFPLNYVIDPRGIVRGVQVNANQFTQYVHAAQLGKSANQAPSQGDRELLAQIDPRHFTFGGDAVTVVRQVTIANSTLETADAGIDLYGGGVVPRLPSSDVALFTERKSAMLQKMITALQPFQRVPQARVLLSTIELERLKEMAPTVANEALKAKYAAQILALEPSNLNAESTYVMALGTLDGAKGSAYPSAVAFALHYAHLHPSVMSYKSVEIAYELVGNMSTAFVWESKSVELERRIAARTPTDANLRTLEKAYQEVALHYSEEGRTQQAERFYGDAIDTISHIREMTPDTRNDAEDAQAGELALRLAGGVRNLDVYLEPWTGEAAPGSIVDAVQYRLVVVAKPGSSIQLNATHYSNGWLPSFCSDNLCTPFHRDISIPSSGVLALEFSMVPNDPEISSTGSGTIRASGNGSVATTSVVSHYFPVDRS